jgi:hypothetical protein
MESERAKTAHFAIIGLNWRHLFTRSDYPTRGWIRADGHGNARIPRKDLI